MPNRIIRDGWLESEAINQLDQGAERFFLRLCLCADDYGRYNANPILLKSNLFPLREDVRCTDISRWLAACEKAGMVRMYQAEAKAFLEIAKFGQRIKDNVKSKFPECPPDGSPDSPQESPYSFGRSRESPRESPYRPGSSPTVPEVPDVPDVLESSQTCPELPGTSGNFRPHSEAEAEAEAKAKAKAEASGARARARGAAEGKKHVTIIPLTLSTDDFRAAWGDWLQHRREKKKPVTPMSEKHSLKELSEMGEARAIAAIRHSIGKGYTGIFEPDARSGGAATATVKDLYGSVRTPGWGKDAPRGNADEFTGFTP